MAHTCGSGHSKEKVKPGTQTPAVVLPDHQCKQTHHKEGEMPSHSMFISSHLLTVLAI